MALQRYEKEFKRQVIRLIQIQGNTVPKVAKDLNLSISTVYRWMAKFKQDNRIRDLEEENSILKKATHFFTKEGR